VRDIPGKVIVQSFVPHHYSIQSAKDHNFLEFYAKEIIFREELLMPPLTHLVKIIMSGILEKEVLRQILLLHSFWKQRPIPRVFGLWVRRLVWFPNMQGGIFGICI